MITKNLSSWKSTLVGILLILASLAYIFFKEEVKPIIALVLGGVGIALLFTPDSLFDGIKSFIGTNKDRKI